MDFRRQKGIFDPEVYKSVKVNIIGVGAVGSFIALALAKMSLSDIEVFDPDKVEEHNLPNQFYRREDVDEFKVIALEDIVWKFAGVRITTHSELYINQPLRGIVVCAVDSMDTRKDIWFQIRRQRLVELYVDVRMGGEVAWIFAIKPALEREFYESNLYSSDEALHIPCSEQSIIYTVLGTACTTACIIKKYLCGEKYPKELQLDFKLGIINQEGNIQCLALNYQI